MITTPDGVDLYSTDEMATALDGQRTKFNEGIQYGQKAKSDALRSEAIEWFTEQARTGIIDSNDALEIYNGLAQALGWATVEAFTSHYTVAVTYNGSIIAEFEDVEAEDEETACQKVRYDLSVESVEVEFLITYDGHSKRGCAEYTYDFDESDLEFEAEKAY